MMPHDSPDPTADVAPDLTNRIVGAATRDVTHPDVLVGVEDATRTAVEAACLSPEPRMLDWADYREVSL
jgi:hypothetical protein